MSNVINIMLTIPTHIVEGLKSGKLERIGSVIRDKADKTVVAWLQETGEHVSQENIEQLVNQCSGGIAKLLANQQLILGMQVAGLAVNVAGFAIMNHKLNNISKQLGHIDEHIKELKQAHKWLDTKHFFSELAPVRSAVEALSVVHLIEDKQNAKQKLYSTDTKLSDAKMYFHQVLGQFAAEKLEYQYPEQFANYYHAWLIAAKSHIHTQVHLNELKLAQALASEFHQQHAMFGEQLMALRSRPENILLRGASPEASQLVGNTLQVCAGAHSILQGNMLQLEHMEKTGLRMEDLPLPEKTNNTNSPFVLVQAS